MKNKNKKAKKKTTKQNHIYQGKHVREVYGHVNACAMDIKNPQELEEFIGELREAGFKLFGNQCFF